MSNDLTVEQFERWLDDIWRRGERPVFAGDAYIQFLDWWQVFRLFWLQIAEACACSR